ncbi:MAG: hypothetical protein ACSHXD_19000 [Marinosulfonomonas sp.]
MGKFGSGIIGAIIGVAVGAVGGLSLGGGAMMGVGVATGLSAGVCSTVQAAQEEGLLTAEQVDQILNRAAADLTSGTNLPEGEQMVGSAAQCDDVMAKLKSAS